MAMNTTFGRAAATAEPLSSIAISASCIFIEGSVGWLLSVGLTIANYATTIIVRARADCPHRRRASQRLSPRAGHPTGLASQAGCRLRRRCGAVGATPRAMGRVDDHDRRVGAVRRS